MAGKQQTSKGLAALIAGVLIAQSLLLFVFAWPATRSAPHKVPLAVAGNPAIVAALSQKLSSEPSQAFIVLPASDRAKATRLVMERKAYGAIVIDQKGATLEIATGASPTIASALQSTLAPALSIALPSGLSLQIRDLAPNPAKDPHGTGIPSSLIPLIIAAIGFGALIAFRQVHRTRKVAGVLTFSVAAGLLVTWILQSLLGALTGSFINNASVFGLGVFSIASLTLGLVSTLGIGGVPISAVIVLILGFPLSGVFGARELLPVPWGTFGSWLPTGALNTALRSSSFFDLTGSAGSLLILSLWAFFGLFLTSFATVLPRLKTEYDEK